MILIDKDNIPIAIGSRSGLIGWSRSWVRCRIRSRIWCRFYRLLNIVNRLMIIVVTRMLRMTVIAITITVAMLIVFVPVRVCSCRVHCWRIFVIMIWSTIMNWRRTRFRVVTVRIVVVWIFTCFVVVWGMTPLLPPSKKNLSKWRLSRNMSTILGFYILYQKNKKADQTCHAGRVLGKSEYIHIPARIGELLPLVFYRHGWIRCCYFQVVSVVDLLFAFIRSGVRYRSESGNGSVDHNIKYYWAMQNAGRREKAILIPGYILYVSNISMDHITLMMVSKSSAPKKLEPCTLIRSISGHWLRYLATFSGSQLMERIANTTKGKRGQGFEQTIFQIDLNRWGRHRQKVAKGNRPLPPKPNRKKAPPKKKRKLTSCAPIQTKRYLSQKPRSVTWSQKKEARVTIVLATVNRNDYGWFPRHKSDRITTWMWPKPWAFTSKRCCPAPVGGRGRSLSNYRSQMLAFYFERGRARWRYVVLRIWKTGLKMHLNSLT